MTDNPLRLLVPAALLLLASAAPLPAQSAGGSRPTASTGEWQFDGQQWQFQPGGVVPSVPTYPPGNPTYPAPGSYAPSPGKVQPSTPLPAVTVYPKASVAGSPLVVVRVGPYWQVRYKRSTYDAWSYYANYGSSSSAFRAATSLSHKGYWAAVVFKR